MLGTQKQQDTNDPSLLGPSSMLGKQIKMCQRTDERFRWENHQEPRGVSQVQGGRESAAAGRRPLGGMGLESGLRGQVGWDGQREGLHSSQRNTLHAPTLTPCFVSNYRGDYQPPIVREPWRSPGLRLRCPALVLTKLQCCVLLEPSRIPLFAGRVGSRMQYLTIRRKTLLLLI